MKELTDARTQATADLAQAQARERSLNVELQLLRQAAKHGANPESLADSRSFMSAIANLDPTSSDFAAELSDAIKTAVERNPRIQARRSGTGWRRRGR